MNDGAKARSGKGDASSPFDFAGVADRKERERLLIEELRRTQCALAEAEIEIQQKQRAIAERAFEQEAADVRSLLHAACWTADFDDEGNPTGFWFSDECRRVLGFESGDGFPENSENSDRFIAPDDLARINNEFRIAATEGGPYDVNYCVRRKDGRRMWVRAAAKFWRDEQGIARSCMGVFVDIDDAVKNQARQQQALEQALERADRACKVKTDFLRRMSHDMRTPLNCILGLLELCERNRDDKALVEEDHGKMRTAARHLLSLIGSTLQGRRLLLVEDNDLNAEIAATIMEDEGAYVSIAGDGAQAVEAFAANPAGTFDAILMDVAMPKMDGLAATRAIRALDRPDAASIPIIAMTGNAFQEDVRECLEAGMNAHIAKPIDMAKAERVIAKVVGEGPPPIKELEIDQ